MALRTIPVLCPQGGPHLPLADFVGKRRLTGLTVGIQCFGLVTLRSLPADDAPGPGPGVGVQLAFETGELFGRHARVVARHARHGDRRQLTLHATLREVGRQLGEPGQRRLGRRLRRLGVGRLALRQVVHGKARCRWAVGFDLAADARPDVVGQHPLGDDQRFEHRIAAFGRLDQRQPKRHRLVERARVAVRPASL